jgi:RNA polymerase sigma-70 factor (ECF subfamily)
MPATDDESLALGVHRCHPGAFDRLVERYEPSLFNYANRILGNAFDAQEVVQDAFLRAHEAITRQYDEGRVTTLTLKPWLFRIVRNLSFNKRRGGASKLDEPLTAFDDNRIGPLVLACSVSAGIERQQEREALDRAIANLPEESRELIVLRFMEEMSYAEMAGIVGQGEAALRGRVFRSLKLLREALVESEVHHEM